MAFAINVPRLIAFVAPLMAGTLITNFGGFGEAAITISFIYVLGFVATLLLPETRGKLLPDSSWELWSLGPLATQRPADRKPGFLPAEAARGWPQMIRFWESQRCHCRISSRVAARSANTKVRGKK